MSIPELTPVETPIFDELVIEQMQKHWDDRPTCHALRRGVHPASVRLKCPACPSMSLMCDEHLAMTQAYIARKIELCGRVQCTCGRVSLSFSEWAEVVPL